MSGHVKAARDLSQIRPEAVGLWVFVYLGARELAPDYYRIFRDSLYPAFSTPYGEAWKAAEGRMPGVVERLRVAPGLSDALTELAQPWGVDPQEPSFALATIALAAGMDWLRCNPDDPSRIGELAAQTSNDDVEHGEMVALARYLGEILLAYWWLGHHLQQTLEPAVGSKVLSSRQSTERLLKAMGRFNPLGGLSRNTAGVF